MAERARGVEVQRFPASRRLVTAAVRAGRRMAPMHGLIDVDVTRANQLLAAQDPPSSLTAFVVATVARAVTAFPEVHAYRNWRGRLVIHRHVDVNTIVEVATRQGPFTLPCVIRDADVRSVADLSDELRGAKREPSSTPSGRLLERLGPLVTRIPGAVRAMYAIMGRSVKLHRQTGTVAVTAVGMFAGGGGFALAPLSLMSLQVVVGGMSARPRVVDDVVVVRDVLDLTVSVDHNVVDGAPATRFGAHLRELLETAAVLSVSSKPVE